MILRCVGMGDKGVGRMQWLLTGCSYVGKRGRQHSDKFLSQHPIFAWAVVFFGAEFFHLLWPILTLQLLQEKVKDHLSPAQTALRKAHCIVAQCMWGSYLPRGEKLMPCCAKASGDTITGHELSANIANCPLLSLQHRRYKPVDKSGSVMIKAWNQSKTKGMPKISANNPWHAEAGISRRLGKMNAVSYWLLAEHPQTP